jgi:hypothetical protein
MRWRHQWEKDAVYERVNLLFLHFLRDNGAYITIALIEMLNMFQPSIEDENSLRTGNRVKNTSCALFCCREGK